MAYKRIIGIYRILNKVTGKCYVGSSTSINSRFNRHLCELRKSRHHSPLLQRSFDKHGVHAFTFEIIELLENDETLLQREQFFIDHYNSANPEFGYNICTTAKFNPRMSKPHTEEFKKRMSETRKGSDNPFYGKKHSPEYVAEMKTRTGENNYYFGRKHSPDVREKISNRLKGKSLSAEHKIKLSKAGKGKIKKTKNSPHKKLFHEVLANEREVIMRLTAIDIDEQKAFEYAIRVYKKMGANEFNVLFATSSLVKYAATQSVKTHRA